MKASPANRKIKEAQAILEALGLPKEQHNERAALTLLALVDVRAGTEWATASSPIIGVTQIMSYVADHYAKRWAPNTRETVRRFTLHQFMQAGLVVANPDEPERPTNSPRFCYQIEPQALDLIRAFGAPLWSELLRGYIADQPTLAERYAQAREMQLIQITTASGQKLALTPGGQNPLVKAIVEQFCARFTPGAIVIYVGDTGDKFAYYERSYLDTLGVSIEEHGKMPDVVVHDTGKNWLFLIEAVTSHGPVSPKRMAELRELFAGSSAGLVFFTAFPDRRTMRK
jgi:hypothetical protein